jgi:hypothetical protein
VLIDGRAWVHQITDEKTLTSVIKNHIKKLVGRYRGKIPNSFPTTSALRLTNTVQA